MTTCPYDDSMTEMFGVAETKRRFAELVDRVLHGERFVVTRHGKPVAALVPPTSEAVGAETEYVGLAAFAGILEDVPEFEEIMAEIVAAREGDFGRPPPDFGEPEAP